MPVKPSKDHLGRSYPTVVEMCRAWNIPYDVYKTRRYRGWDTQKSLTTPYRSTCRDHMGQEYPSRSAMCRAYGINPATFLRRLQNGWPLERALTEPLQANQFVSMKDRHPASKKSRGRKRALTLVTGPDGHIYPSAKALCDAYGINVTTYWERRRKGVAMVDALKHGRVEAPEPTHPVFDHLGHRFRTIKEMCDAYGISTSAYVSRLERGWNIERSLTEKNWKDIDMPSFYIGRKNVMLNGMDVEITAYRNAHDLDVRFADGTLVQHRSLSNFLNGRIGYPGKNLSTMTKEQEYLGKRFRANNGTWMTITAYNKASDVEVTFDTGEVVPHRQLPAVIRGQVNPEAVCKRTDLGKLREGEIATAINGLRMKLVKYRASSHIEVQFEDGTCVTSKYTAWKNRCIGHPGLKQGCYVFHGFKIHGRLCIGGQIYYRAEDPEGKRVLATPQDLMAKAGIAPVF